MQSTHTYTDTYTLVDRMACGARSTRRTARTAIDWDWWHITRIPHAIIYNWPADGRRFGMWMPTHTHTHTVRERTTKSLVCIQVRQERGVSACLWRICTNNPSVHQTTDLYHFELNHLQRADDTEQIYPFINQFACDFGFRCDKYLFHTSQNICAQMALYGAVLVCYVRKC